MVRPSELRYLARGATQAERARDRLRYLGRMPWGDLLWTERELAVCRELYPDYAAIEKKLKRRTSRTIRERCRILGLTQPLQPWTAAEKTRLRKLFATATWSEICAAFPDRSRGAIVRAAYKWGFRRPRQPYKPTCHPALDQVRARCVETGLFMPDLDEFARSGTFFRKKAYRRKKPDLLAVDRAANALGGKLQIDWTSDDVAN